MKRFILSLAVAAVAVVFATPAFAQGNAAAGEKVYAKENCKMCHSIAGVGNKKNPLDGVGTKLSADDIKLWIQKPKDAEEKFKSTATPKMKAYPDLKDPDLSDLVAYMESLKK